MKDPVESKTQNRGTWRGELLEGRQQEQTPASFQQNPVINVGIPINSLSVPDNTHMRVEVAAKAASPLDGKV